MKDATFEGVGGLKIFFGPGGLTPERAAWS